MRMFLSGEFGVREFRSYVRLLFKYVDLPYNGGVCYSHDDESEEQVPAVTHGDEHHVAVIGLIPLHLIWGVQHKSNLGKGRAESYTTTTIIQDGTGLDFEEKKK